MIRARSGRPTVPRTDTLTGAVFADPASTPGEEPFVNDVVFTPGARTYWHRHGGGQLIVVSHGRGWVVRADGYGGPVEAGQSVWTAPGELHWHGAGPESFWVQRAYSFGTTAEWFAEVSDEEYARAVQEARW
ncbi:AraC family ligand binding domain-containing protein [Pseudonocardia zijingensis]